MNYSSLGRVWLVTSRLGDRKIGNLFFTVYHQSSQNFLVCVQTCTPDSSWFLACRLVLHSLFSRATIPLCNYVFCTISRVLHVRKRGPALLHPPPGMPDYDDLCDELTYDELTDGLSTCSGSVNDLLDQLEVEEYRHNDCHKISEITKKIKNPPKKLYKNTIFRINTLPLVASMS
jgi:hypothetical protein